MSLTDLPPELLGQIVDVCAADLTHGRAALLNLSVMNKYVRSVTESRLFERIVFRDGPHSPGDEILHSIRRFMAAPGLRHYARTVCLCLKRLKCLGQGHATCSEPYHYLILPELMEALAAMPEVRELSIRTEGAQGRICLEGLQAAARWGAARQQTNIRSLIVSPYTSIISSGSCSCEEIYNEIDFLGAFPQLEAFLFEGIERHPPEHSLTAGDSYHPTMASNLKHLRLYKSSSDPRSGFHPAGWRQHDISGLDFANVTPQLEHLSILGELRGFPVSRILHTLPEIPKLKYLDITDEQMQKAERERPANRSLPAEETFEMCAQLRRIVFVWKGVGEVYMRGHWSPVADSTGYISEDVNDADLCEIPNAWCHGVPQTSLTPFPSFTPWEGKWSLARQLGMNV